MKIIIGILTFNCLKYTKICLKNINCSFPHEILIVDNGSTDGTIEWLKTQSVTLIEHGQNLGVPYASNTMYDYAWKDDPDNLLIVLSNDMLCLPNTVDNLIKAAQLYITPVIGGRTVPTPLYLADHPEDRVFFSGGDIISTLATGDYATWSRGECYNLIEETAEEFVKSVGSKLVVPEFEVVPGAWFVPGHRIYRKSYFDANGYWDANFYPVYMVDNDYAMRARMTGTIAYYTQSSVLIEFWSRVLYEGSVPIVDVRREAYFSDKWGPGLAYDVWEVPFNGEFPAKYAGYDTSQIRIGSREGELDRVKELMGAAYRDITPTISYPKDRGIG